MENIHQKPTPPLPLPGVKELIKKSVTGDIRRQRWNVCQVIARQFYQADLPEEVMYKEIKYLSKRIIKLKQCNPQSEKSLWSL